MGWLINLKTELLKMDGKIVSSTFTSRPNRSPYVPSPLPRESSCLRQFPDPLVQFGALVLPHPSKEKDFLPHQQSFIRFQLLYGILLLNQGVQVRF